MEQLLTDRFIIGNPADCIRAITSLHAALGVNHFLFRVQWPGIEPAKVLRTIRLIGEAVIPALKSEISR